jgi:hypothetical protein
MVTTSPVDVVGVAGFSVLVIVVVVVVIVAAGCRQ